jgi:DNA-binding CsgD family transcriptional regulator
LAVTSESALLSELIGVVYDAALDPPLWPRAIEKVCRFVGGSSANLFWHDAATEQSAQLHLFNNDPHYTKLYFEKYFSLNPCFPAATFYDAGQVYGSTDLVPFEEMLETVFYEEWMKPQGVIDSVAANLEKSATSSSIIAIQMHEADGLADAENRRLALIVPHLQRAVSIGRLFDQNRTAQAVLLETLDNVTAGVFLVGANGRLVFANGPGRALLNDGALLTERMGALTAVSPQAQRALREALAAAENGNAAAGNPGPIPLLTSLRGGSFAYVLPLTTGDRQRTGALHSAVAAVFVRKTSPANPPPLEALAKLYKLTASEVRIVDAVMKVDGVRALAETLGLTQATVKTHLHNVFRKTDTAGQTELVKLIAGFAPSEQE